VLDRWDELVHEHRHFGFFWLPTEESAALYNLSSHDQTMADKCYVKIYDEAAPDQPDSDVEGRRTDRCYRIYPMVYDPNFHELEYFVPLELGPDALSAMRDLMLRSLPDSIFPLEVRTVGPDDAYLSPNYRTATTVISVSGKPGTDYWDYLRSVDSLLQDFSARVHWGKLHFLTPERLHALYPEADAFINARRELDPAGIFLNDHLRELFA
jgi:FAD/FMN-containing dehydrogenase